MKFNNIYLSATIILTILLISVSCLKREWDNPYEAIKIEMVNVEGGTFQMGNDEGYYDEKPVHTVKLSSFYIGKYEVTQKQWNDVMGNNPSYYSNCDDCPVERISWNEIQTFLQKLNELNGGNYRLPTEAEWEYAARGGNLSQGYTYSGSNNPDQVSWYNSSSGTHPVGTKGPNELGIHDMSGNVYEACNDWYNENFYSYSLENNPQGPVNGTGKVVRGGAYGSTTSLVVTYRTWILPDDLYIDVGFRLVRNP